MLTLSTAEGEAPAFPCANFYVYILSSKSRVLYTGVTDNIYRRTWEHKNDVHPGFTSDYKVHRLVYYETFKYVNNAIAREKVDQGMAAAKERLR